ncbi:MAG: transposase [Gallionellaceae bacterium]|jgi:putative transposase
MFILLCLWLIFLWHQDTHRRALPYGRQRLHLPIMVHRSQRKPPWVKQELIRLKALMPVAGCRTLTDIFNRRFAVSRRMTVGKSFVSDVICKHLYEIQILRKKIKHAKPKQVPVNLVWAMDLTGKTDTQGALHMLLGIVDHGSRALLCLQALPNKSSWTLLGHLFLAIGKYGKPRFVRTDNESVFCSRLFRGMLALLGIRHQRTDPGCPWQNGRIERFFGILKHKLDQWSVASVEELGNALVQFRFFYNHVRTHQNLSGRTPAEAWSRVDIFTDKPKTEYWFEACGGLLQGFYLHR